MLLLLTKDKVNWSFSGTAKVSCEGDADGVVISQFATERRPPAFGVTSVPAVPVRFVG